MATNAQVAEICSRWATAVDARVNDVGDTLGSREHYALLPLREAGVYFVEQGNAQEGAKLVLTQSVAGVNATE